MSDSSDVKDSNSTSEDTSGAPARKIRIRRGSILLQGVHKFPNSAEPTVVTVTEPIKVSEPEPESATAAATEDIHEKVEKNIIQSKSLIVSDLGTGPRTTKVRRSSLILAGVDKDTAAVDLNSKSDSKESPSLSLSPSSLASSQKQEETNPNITQNPSPSPSSNANPEGPSTAADTPKKRNSILKIFGMGKSNDKAETSVKAETSKVIDSNTSAVTVSSATSTISPGSQSKSVANENENENVDSTTSVSAMKGELTVADVESSDLTVRRSVGLPKVHIPRRSSITAPPLGTPTSPESSPPPPPTSPPPPLSAILDVKVSVEMPRVDSDSGEEIDDDELVVAAEEILPVPVVRKPKTSVEASQIPPTAAVARLSLNKEQQQKIEQEKQRQLQEQQRQKQQKQAQVEDQLSDEDELPPPDDDDVDNDDDDNKYMEIDSKEKASVRRAAENEATEFVPEKTVDKYAENKKFAANLAMAAMQKLSSRKIQVSSEDTEPS